MFLQNGVKADELDDYQQAREHQTRDRQFSISFLFVLVFTFTLAMTVYDLSISAESRFALEISLLALLAVNFLVALFSFRIVAIDRGYLPGSSSKPSDQESDRIEHNHVTGFGAAVILLLLSFLIIAAVLGERNYQSFSIPEEFGLLVILGISLGFLSLIFAPRFTDVSVLNSILSVVRNGTSFLNPLGKALSTVDSWMVHTVAPISGVTEEKWLVRYFILGGNLLATSLFAWLGPPVFATAAVTWAVIIAISVTRRWSWIESDRDQELRGESTREFSRIEVTQDLRDEALFALLFLIFVLPLGMRQVHQMYDGSVFEILPKSKIDDPLAWLGFFGVEMIKALPFVDWSDIYGAHGATSIKFETPGAMHLVFGARVLIDLVFLSALVQAISISVSLGKHKRRFLARENGVNKLDVRIEVSELSKLAKRDRHGRWQFRPELANFLHYDSDRLSFLRIKCRRNDRLQATIGRIFDLNHYVYQPPGEKLVEEAMQGQPNKQRVMEFLDAIEELGDYDLDYLEPAREGLNFKGGFQEERLRVAEFITRSEISPQKERALANMSQDSWAPVRAKVLPIFGRNKASARAAQASLMRMANQDGAESLQNWAIRILKRYNLWKFGDVSPA